MKINEIYTDKGIQDFVEHLKQYGEVKNGAYAYVYMPAGKDYCYRAWTNDIGYSTYLDIVSNNNNESFIKVHKIITLDLHINHEKQKIRIAKIEKLKPVNLKLIKFKGTRYSQNYDMSLYDLIHIPSDSATQKAIDYNAPDSILSQYSNFLEAFDIISNAVKRNSLLVVDVLQKNNIMKRKNGTIVFSDPISTTFMDKTLSLVDISTSNTIVSKITKSEKTQ